MTSTHWVELFQNIRKNIISFIAIVIFVALGIAIFIGFSFSGNAFLCSVDSMLQHQKLCHFELYNEATITDKDLERCEKWDGIDKVEGEIEGFSELKLDHEIYNVRLNSITEDLNKLTVHKGRLPDGKNQVAVERNFAETSGIKTGDMISFTSPQEVSLLAEQDFTVTAIVDSSTYFSRTTITYGNTRRDSRPVDGVFYFNKKAFITPHYTSALLYSNKLGNTNTFSDRYDMKSDEIKSDLEKNFMKDGETITDRSAIGGVDLADAAGSIVVDLKYSLSLFFVIIAVLICYSTIERLILEQTILIGTKKALGMRKAEIRNYYMAFALIVSLVGILIGTVLGLFVIRPVMVKAIADNFVIDAFASYFDPGEYVFIVAVELFFILAAALITVHRVIGKEAIILLNNTVQRGVSTHFYERAGWFQRMSLMSKTMLNNISSDRKRCLTTLLSVIGCTALISCSLFMENSITSSIKDQFNDYYHFNDIIYLDNAEDDAESNVVNFLDKEGIGYAGVCQTAGLMSVKDEPAVYVGYYVPEDESFFDIVDMESTDAKAIKTIDGNYISRAFADEYDIDSGDQVKLQDNLGNEITAEIDDSFEYYLISNQMILSKDTYKNLTGRECKTNALLIDAESADTDSLRTKLEKVDGYASLSAYKDDSVIRVKSFTTAAIAVVVIYLVLSIIMALLVILNLLNMYVFEKKKDMIVLLINGYDRKRVKKYIFADTVLISAVGIVLGEIAGTFLGILVTKTFITAEITFSLVPNPVMCLAGMLIAGIIVFATVLISMRKIDGLKITDI